MLLITVFTAFAGNEEIDKISRTDANVFGHVVEKETGNHIPGAAVTIEGTTIGTVTDASGHFKFTNLKVGKWTLKVRILGYKTVTKKINAVKGKTLEVKFELEED